MADLIFDIQFLRDKNRKLIAKEIAVTSIQGNITGHWLIKSQHNFENLPNHLMVSNNFFTTQIHGIEWWEGDILIEQLKSHIYDLTKNAKLIYTRGSDNVKFLESLLCRHVIDFAIYHAPSFSQLREIYSDENIVCTTHACQKKLDNILEICALNKVKLLKHWFHSILPEKWGTSDLTSTRAYNALREYTIQNFEEGYDVVDDFLKDTVENETLISEDYDDNELDEEKISKNEYTGDHASDLHAAKKNKNSGCVCF